jgi:3',5'-cyclic-AMP phosphodiesterase
MRVAHLSDVHLIAARSQRPTYGLRSRAVRFGRTNDPSIRGRRLATALRTVKASGADHLVVSGDLTELGDEAEYELFGEILADAGIDPERVTLIPGNHDAYTARDGWKRALEGPLAPWASASARASWDAPLVDRGDCAFIPLDVTIHQSMVWSGGELRAETARRIDALAKDPALAKKPVVMVIHHPPFPKHDNVAYKLVDSLKGSELVYELLAKHPNLHLLHGHFHRVLDRERMFGAPGVADDLDNEPRVRLYDVKDAALVSAGLGS